MGLTKPDDQDVSRIILEEKCGGESEIPIGEDGEDGGWHCVPDMHVVSFQILQ